MVQIVVCVGSSCHLKGARLVVDSFKNMIAEYGLEDCTELQLMGSFCQEHCTKGVVVKVNDQLFLEVTPEGAGEIFQKHVIPFLTCKVGRS